MRLIFVYNANSGRLNTILDSLHKITNPSTYQCKLCALTFGYFSEDKIWKDFRATSEIEMNFYHKDEFLSKFRSKWLAKFEFPLIILEQNGELELFLSSEELDKIDSVDLLIEEVKKRQILC